LKPLFSGPAFPGTIVEAGSDNSFPAWIKLAAHMGQSLQDSEVISSVQTQIVSLASGRADIIFLTDQRSGVA
jgi:hypothetical protein